MVIHQPRRTGIWRIAALFGVIELAIILMTWGIFLISGEVFRDHTPQISSSRSNLPLYQRTLLFLTYNQLILYLALPLLLFHTTWGLFRRDSGRPCIPSLPVLTGVSLLAVSVSPFAALLASRMSPIADGRFALISVSGQLHTQVIIASVAFGLIFLPVILGCILYPLRGFLKSS